MSVLQWDRCWTKEAIYRSLKAARYGLLASILCSNDPHCISMSPPSPRAVLSTSLLNGMNDKHGYGGGLPVDSGCEVST